MTYSLHKWPLEGGLIIVCPMKFSLVSTTVINGLIDVLIMMPTKKVADILLDNSE